MLVKAPPAAPGHTAAPPASWTVTAASAPNGPEFVSWLRSIGVVDPAMWEEVGECCQQWGVVEVGDLAGMGDQDWDLLKNRIPLPQFNQVKNAIATLTA